MTTSRDGVYWRRRQTLLFICRRHIAVVRSHFFGNNSGKPERIGTKFYVETSAHVARSTDATPNFWRQTGAKWRRKTHFPNFFVTKTTRRFTHFMRRLYLSLTWLKYDIGPLNQSIKIYFPSNNKELQCNKCYTALERLPEKHYAHENWSPVVLMDFQRATLTSWLFSSTLSFLCIFYYFYIVAF